MGDTGSVIELPDEAMRIARWAAAERGRDVREWLVQAINAHAARQVTIDQIPVDDCGFFSPLPEPQLAH